MDLYRLEKYNILIKENQHLKSCYIQCSALINNKIVQEFFFLKYPKLMNDAF